MLQDWLWVLVMCFFEYCYFDYVDVVWMVGVVGVVVVGVVEYELCYFVLVFVLVGDVGVLVGVEYVVGL